MILAVVKAAALQFFGAVLPVIMAGLGMAVILVVFPPLTFQPILIAVSYTHLCPGTAPAGDESPGRLLQSMTKKPKFFFTLHLFF